MTPRIKTAKHSPVKKSLIIQISRSTQLITTNYFLSTKQPQRMFQCKTPSLPLPMIVEVQNNVSPSCNSFQLACVFPNTLYLILQGLNQRIRLFSQQIISLPESAIFFSYFVIVLLSPFQPARPIETYIDGQCEFSRTSER